jgi:hypothetical protein
VAIPLARQADLAPFDFITMDSKLQAAEPGDLLILCLNLSTCIGGMTG